MESILSSFHLDLSSFSELLHATGGVVAGSAALAAYVTGTPNTFTPNDLDIWVHSDFFPDILTDEQHPCIAVRRGYLYLFSYFMRQHGYKEVQRPMQSDTEYKSNPVFAILRCIQRFQHPSGRVVQVMHCKVDVDAILDSFDLSVAQTWWVPSPHNREGHLYTRDAESVRAGVMYPLRATTTCREKERIQKYEARGFKMMYY
jgi:hypothetical protein